MLLLDIKSDFVTVWLIRCQVSSIFNQSVIKCAMPSTHIILRRELCSQRSVVVMLIIIPKLITEHRMNTYCSELSMSINLLSLKDITVTDKYMHCHKGDEQHDMVGNRLTQWYASKPLV